MKKFSPKWVASAKEKKQRKYRAEAPLHIKGEFLSAHLSKELRVKYAMRSVRLRTGDKVKVMRGSLRGKSGKVDRIDIRRMKVFIVGVMAIRKDGSKNLLALEPSNLLVTEIVLDDKRRKRRFIEDKNGKATP